jgi:hypothetical protein
MGERASETLRGFVSMDQYHQLACERDRLREELDRYRRELSFETDENRRGPRAWGLTRLEAWLMRQLAARPLVSHERLYSQWPDWTPSGMDGPGETNIKTMISRLRVKLARFGVAIETRRGVGYALPDARRGLVHQAMDTGAPDAVGAPVPITGAVAYGPCERACAVLAVCASGDGRRKTMVGRVPGHAGQVTGIIQRLAARGAITRRRVSGREIYNQITPRGERLLARLRRMGVPDRKGGGS